jgi:NAD(P)-dependent dehydrogenase (short-subunit alcohol dehydrogenase family)
VSVELRHFRSFVVMAEEGNIGRAAARLFITQPALSRQLQQLEAHLGVSLFSRVPSGIELTEAGRELLGKARTALEAAEEALTIGRPVETDLWLGEHGVAATVAAMTGVDAETAREQVVAGIGGFATGRFTRPDEVAALAAMLASDALGNVTGANVVIDGGLIKTL